jgi:galactokinase
MDSSLADAKLYFQRLFGAGGKVHVVRAPGRVNLIGEHTDYNQGLVFPMAIDPHVLVICRGRDDGQVRLASTAFEGEISGFSVQKHIERADPTWSNYGRGVAAELIAAGIPLTGMDALIANTLPVGGGLSSSAAIMVGLAQAFLTIAGLSMNIDRMAVITQKAEHEYAGTPSGIMDMTIVAGAKAGHAMLLDCRDLSREYVTLDSKELRLLIVNTMLKHELHTGEYAQRRKECEQGVAFFQRSDPAVKSLRDVSMQQLSSSQGQLPPTIFRRCRHVVSEIARTAAAAALLGRRDYDEFGQKMAQSHASLRDDYEVSTPELDFLSDQAMKLKGVYGARMTGGGFGGCIVALVQPRSVDAVSGQLSSAYHAKFKVVPEIYVTTAAAGVSVLE